MCSLPFIGFLSGIERVRIVLFVAGGSKAAEPRVIEKIVHVTNKEEIEAEKKRIREVR